MLTVTVQSRKAGALVDTHHVDTLIRNYKQERWLQNSRHIGKEDSMSIWYSLEELEAFLRKAKSAGADGIRMYFGVYDKEIAKEELYEDRQTIVLVATQAKETPNGVMDKNLYVNTPDGNSILAYNVGRPCPPFCKPGIGDADSDGLGITIVDKGNDGIVML